MAKLKLLPLPKSVREKQGTFKLEDDLPLLIGPGSDREVNAAWSFAAEAGSKAGVRLSVERMGKLDGIGRRILFLLEGRDERLYSGLAALAAPLAKVPPPVRDQAYVLEVTPNDVVAVASSAQGLYYAAQTLRQMITRQATLPCVKIVDWPTYIHRGVMLDISRFKVPRLDTLFALIERLASLKINVFQLYTEHTFTFRRHPDIGKDCGSMSAEDIIELDEFCKEHFVDLNANLQSFGHHKEMLSIPKYNNLAEMPEAPWTLCPVDDRIYDLLDDLYAECLPAYSSPMFNASCDETWELGKGRSRKQAAKVGLGRVYLEHIKKINALAHTYGKQMMIWADIVLQYPELIPEIPNDIIMLDWGYEKHSDMSGLEQIRQAGLEHWTCPGVNSWQRVFCDLDNACGNITRRAVAGEASGATGLLNTDWGDNGHAQCPSASYHGYAFGAEQSWTPNAEVAPADFDRRFAWAWFDDASGLFGKLYRETGLINKDTRTKGYAKPFDVYWDAFPCTDILEKLPERVLKDRSRRARRAFEMIPKLAERCPEHRDVLREMLFGVGQVLFNESKIELSREINARREAGKPLTAGVKKAVQKLLDEWNEQAEEFEDIWTARNRPSQIAYRLSLYRERARDYKKLLR
jgi:hexosaminidase